jgi:RNA polymerase sigma-70 factor (ECF subfamily)
VSIDSQADPQIGTRRVTPALPPVELEIPAAGFDAFYARELPRLVTVLTAVTGDQMVAEELAQEALLRAHQRWARISRYDLPGAWVRRVALNLASQSRARRRSEHRAVARTIERGPVAPPEPTDDFWALVRQLPPRQAAAVALHYLEDRPVTEVASILGCAEGTAKAHLHKGRATLARLLQSTETTDGP